MSGREGCEAHRYIRYLVKCVKIHLWNSKLLKAYIQCWQAYSVSANGPLALDGASPKWYVRMCNVPCGGWTKLRGMNSSMARPPLSLWHQRGWPRRAHRHTRQVVPPRHWPGPAHPLHKWQTFVSPTPYVTADLTALWPGVARRGQPSVNSALLLQGPRGGTNRRGSIRWILRLWKARQTGPSDVETVFRQVPASLSAIAKETHHRLWRIHCNNLNTTRFKVLCLTYVNAT